MQGSKPVYFPNLDGIRFIAALMVIVNHVEQISLAYDLPNCFDNEFIKKTGRLGVCLFFVLSGFLITFLLFREEKVTRTVSLKWFYIRRILRIWPLYFLIILLGLFVYRFIPALKFPLHDYTIYNGNMLSILLLFIFFMPNIVLIKFGAIPYVAQTWSIGTEEQFYLFWPVLNKYIRNKLVLIIGVFCLFFFAKTFFAWRVAGNESYRFWHELMITIPIQHMAIGAFFAYIASYPSRFLDLLRTLFFHRLVQVLAFASLLLIILFNIYIPYIQEEYMCFVFGLIIYNAALNDKNVFLLNNKPLSYLGKISYGLYMYHPVAIVFSIIMMKYLGLSSYKMLTYALVLTVSIGVSVLSYEYFEKYFFKLKNKFKLV